MNRYRVVQITYGADDHVEASTVPGGADIPIDSAAILVAEHYHTQTPAARPAAIAIATMVLERGGRGEERVVWAALYPAADMMVAQFRPPAVPGVLEGLRARAQADDVKPGPATQPNDAALDAALDAARAVVPDGDRQIDDVVGIDYAGAAVEPDARQITDVEGSRASTTDGPRMLRRVRFSDGWVVEFTESGPGGDLWAQPIGPDGARGDNRPVVNIGNETATAVVAAAAGGAS